MPSARGQRVQWDTVDGAIAAQGPLLCTRLATGLQVSLLTSSFQPNSACTAGYCWAQTASQKRVDSSTLPTFRVPIVLPLGFLSIESR